MSHHRCGEEIRQESSEEYKKTLEVMNQMNERIDKRTDNLEDRQRIGNGSIFSELPTGRITGSEVAQDCCGHYFETAYSVFRLVP